MNVKHGFSSTLNRFLGKKSKGHQLSKSTTNLSLSSHIDSIPLSSHLDQNRIAPLPVATSNAPFEQTFRITVLLPKGQLYVTRLGAKTKLEKLLELVCENKQLDSEKYEFRHPIDTSQVFSCELTIGAVGLSEIRLCHKSEAYDNFNADEIIKLRHTGRDSLSSSEFSSRNSKNTLKTASPYSSTNSLNSIDSTGMSTNYRGAIVSLPPQIGNHRTSGNHHPPVAPARKKRVAPRPPSQNSIPERDVSVVNESKEVHLELSKPKKDFHVSSPNLSLYTELSKPGSTANHQKNIAIDCNGNNNNSKNNNKQNGFVKANGHIYCNGGHTSPDVVQKSIPKDKSAVICESDTNGNRYSSENDLSSHRSSNGSILSYIANDCIENAKLPEPVPRKRVIISKKKAPAPPPRSLPPPTAPPRTVTPNTSPQKETIMIEDIVPETSMNGDVSMDLGRVDQEDERNMENIISIVKTKENEISKQIKYDITKVESEIEEKKEEEENSIVEPPVIEVVQKPLQMLILDGSNSTNQSVQVINEVSSPEEQTVQTTSTSLQNAENNSTITNEGEPPTSPVEISVSEDLQTKPKKQLDSSSDEEEVKVYNLKLGSIVKSMVEQKSIKDSRSTSPTSDSTSVSKDVDTNDGASTRSASPGWTYTIPAPPNFADISMSTSATVNDTVLNNKPILSEADETISIDTAKSTSSDLISDVPITPIIKDRPCVDFESFTDNTTTVNEASNTDHAENTENVITSDIEDGYRVGLNKNDKKSVLIDQLNKKDDFVKMNSEEISLNKRHIDDFCRTRQLSSPSCSPSSLESYDSCKSDVITELNNAINEQKQLTHRIEDSTGIESVKPCALSNFKIQAYSNPNGSINTAVERHENNTIEINVTNGKVFENSNETQCPPKDHTETQPKPLLEEEKMYRKRSSLTLSNNPLPHLSRPRGSISRSDSFHSTRYPNNLNNEESLTLRSSSFLSLLNAQKMDQRTNTNGNFTESIRQKSASELSIGESPSLQSLIVMKSILNSRKNSLTNENVTQKSSTMNQKIYINPEENIRKSTQVETVSDCDSSKENSPKNKMLSQQTTSMEKFEKNDEPEKRWKYQGPPAINLSTWSERPKVQVSIKDDSDYKFGGGGCVSVNGVTSGNDVATFSSNYRHSTPNVPLFAADVAVSNKIQIREKVFNEPPRVPFVRSVEYKKPTSNAQIEVEPKSLNDTEASHYSRPLSTGNTMTLGRIPKISRTNFIPVVRGFRNFEQVEDKDKIQKEINGVQGNSHGENITVLKVTTNGIHRSNSKVSGQPMERNILKLSNSNNKFPSHNVFIEKEKSANVSPFQVTLRKTGFKEKIISSTEVDNEISPMQRFKQQNGAKIEMKLTAVQSPNKVIIEPSQKYQQRQQKQSTPPPPPPPVIRSVVTKQPSCIQTGTTAEPRDQLLYAIRNFNKDFLRRQ